MGDRIDDGVQVSAATRKIDGGVGYAELVERQLTWRRRNYDWKRSYLPGRYVTIFYLLDEIRLRVVGSLMLRLEKRATCASSSDF